MSITIWHPSLCLCILVLSEVKINKGDKYIGDVLRMKLNNYIISAKNNIDHKLWMKYLEKSLVVASQHLLNQATRKRSIFSLRDYHKLNVRKKMFNAVFNLCATEDETTLDIIQTGIFGSICASSKHGTQVPGYNACRSIPKSRKKDRMFCEYFTSKCYTFR